MTHPDLPALVRARLVEAAEVERRMHVHGLRPGQASTAWPEHVYTAKDRDGWTAEDKAEWQDEQMRRRGAKATEVTNWEEAIGWLRLVSCEALRRAVWAWARARAGGPCMKLWCRSVGIHENTGKRRADAAVDDIVRAFRNDPRLLPAWTNNPVVTEAAEPGMDHGMMGSGADDAHRPSESITGIPQKGIDLLDPGDPVPDYANDPDAVRSLERHVAAHNRRMRRLRELRLAKIEREAA
jgi:hypothetical protein